MQFHAHFIGAILTHHLSRDHELTVAARRPADRGALRPDRGALRRSTAGARIVCAAVCAKRRFSRRKTGSHAGQPYTPSKAGNSAILSRTMSAYGARSSRSAAPLRTATAKQPHEPAIVISCNVSPTTITREGGRPNGS